MAAANVCYHMRIPVANEKTWYHLLPKLSSPDNLPGYIIHIVYNLLHVMLDDNCIIIWTSDCYVLLVCMILPGTVESRIKQLNCI